MEGVGSTPHPPSARPPLPSARSAQSVRSVVTGLSSPALLCAALLCSALDGHITSHLHAPHDAALRHATPGQAVADRAADAKLTAS